MKFFSFFNKKKKEEENLFSMKFSCITCFATNCFFNRYYRGENSFDLKELNIDDTGKCLGFTPRRETAEFIANAQENNTK